MRRRKLEMPKGRAPGEPEQKIEVLRRHMAAGEWREAFKMAAAFPQLGAEKVAIQRGWEAFARPDFCRQLKRDPEAMIESGKDALRRRYSV